MLKRLENDPDVWSEWAGTSTAVEKISLMVNSRACNTQIYEKAKFN